MHPDRSASRPLIAWMQSLVVAATLAAMPALGQFSTPDPDWKETDAPTPPAFSVDRLIPLEMPRGALRYGVDPTSVSLGSDGIVRYMVIASSATGAVNAIYEGIRCNSAEVKVYAHHNADSGWTPVRDAVWRPLHGNYPSRHSLTVARTGACSGHSANRSAAQIVRDLRAPADTRFGSEMR